MRNAIRNDGAASGPAGQAAPLPVPRESEGEAMPLPVAKPGEGTFKPLPLPREGADVPAPLPKPDASDGKAHREDKGHAVTRRVATESLDRAKEHHGRLNNFGAAFRIASREVGARIYRRADGVYDLKPPTELERFVQEWAKGATTQVVPSEPEDVAARRRAWEETARSGDPDRMTRAANDLIRAVTHARSRGEMSAAGAGDADPMREILNPQRGRSIGEYGHATHEGAVLWPDVVQANNGTLTLDWYNGGHVLRIPPSASSSIEYQPDEQVSSPGDRGIVGSAMVTHAIGPTGLAMVQEHRDNDDVGLDQLEDNAGHAVAEESNALGGTTAVANVAQEYPQSGQPERPRLLPNTRPGTFCRGRSCRPARHSLEIDDVVPEDIRRVEAEAIAREYGPYSTVNSLKRKREFHQYYLETRITAPGKSCAQVKRQTQIRAVPQLSYRDGPWRDRPARTDDWTWVWAIPLVPGTKMRVPMPGGYVYHYVDRRTGALVNMTTALHPLNPGYIIRWVTCERDGTFTIHTLGRGTGNFAAINETMGPSIFSDLDVSVAEDMGGQVLSDMSQDDF